MDRRDFLRVLGGGAALSVVGGALLSGAAEAQPPRHGHRGPDRHGPPPKRKGQWVFLGDQRVSFRTERDVIRVGRHEGKFDALGLEAEGSDVHVIAITVHFTDRSSARVKLDEVIRARGRSRVIDLPGRARGIEYVEFTYRSVGRSPRPATLRLYGIT